VSYRPLDWAPLAETDPLPGDPQAIWDEAARLRDMAAEVQDQIAALRGIGEVDLVGEYVEELFASAEGVAKKLDLVRDRYVKVAGYLNQWAGELDDLQRRTLAALDNALDAERLLQRDAHADLPGVVPSGYLGAHLIEPAEAPALAVLAKARQDLQRVLDEATARDRHWGSVIGGAIDDNLTDHWRDHLHHWVERHHGMIKGLTTALGVITTAVVLGAIACPLLAPAAIGLTYANLAVHSAEFAVGDGSVLDIVLDVGALRSLRVAGEISKGLEATFKGTREMASVAARREAVDAARRETSEAWAKAEGVLADKASSRASQWEARETKAAIKRRVLKEGNDAASQVLEAPSAKVGPLKAFLAGSKTDAHLVNDTRGLLATYSEDTAVQRAGAPLESLAASGRANFMAAATVDLNDKAASIADVYPGGTPDFAKGYLGWYNERKERFVMSGGSLR
jgi:hypothetical protein